MLLLLRSSNRHDLRLSIGANGDDLLLLLLLLRKHTYPVSRIYQIVSKGNGLLKLIRRSWLDEALLVLHVVLLVIQGLLEVHRLSKDLTLIGDDHVSSQVRESPLNWDVLCAGGRLNRDAGLKLVDGNRH